MEELAKQIFSEGLGDGKVCAISWTDKDLIVDVDLPDGASVPGIVRLSFKWVTKLRIDLDYGEYAGRPLMFGAEVQGLAHDRWRVRFDFGAAPDGDIEFECNDISVIAQPKASPS